MATKFSFYKNFSLFKPFKWSKEENFYKLYKYRLSRLFPFLANPDAETRNSNYGKRAKCEMSSIARSVFNSLQTSRRYADLPNPLFYIYIYISISYTYVLYIQVANIHIQVQRWRIKALQIFVLHTRKRFHCTQSSSSNEMT